MKTIEQSMDAYLEFLWTCTEVVKFLQVPILCASLLKQNYSEINKKNIQTSYNSLKVIRISKYIRLTIQSEVICIILRTKHSFQI